MEEILNKIMSDLEILKELKRYKFYRS